MKKEKHYTLDIFIDETGELSHRERAEGFTIDDMRQVVYLLGELSFFWTQEIRNHTQVFDLKNKQKQ